jgi:hypothetical protein
VTASSSASSENIPEDLVEASAVRTLDELRRHIARAALMSGRLHLELARAASATLAAIGLAARVVDETGKVLDANRLVEALDGYIRWRAFDRVSLCDKAADVLLREAIATRPGRRGKRALVPHGTGVPCRARYLLHPDRREMPHAITLESAQLCDGHKPNHRLDPAERQTLSFGLAPAPLCLITYAATRMKPTSDTCPIGTRLPSDNRPGGTVPADPVLEPQKQAENALHSAGPGWNPYEVWRTQVRAVQLARSSNMHSSLPGAKRERKENSWYAGLSKVTRTPLGKLLKWRPIRLPDR